MNLRFTIIDYNTNPAGDSTVIDEPVGWDGIALRLKRDADRHGFFDFTDNSIASMRFTKDGFALLKSAYETYGVQSVMDILIEYTCDDAGAYTELYRGRLNFALYKDNCGDECSVEMVAHNLSCAITLNNRWDQPVNLESRLSFDRQCTGETSIDCSGDFLSTINEIRITAITGHPFLHDVNGLQAGDSIDITGSASNNGIYTIKAVLFSSGNLYIAVKENLVHELDTTFTLTGCPFLVLLDAYAGLGKHIGIPSKKIQFASKWVADGDLPYTYELAGQLPKCYRTALTPFLTDKLNEIDKTNTGTGLFVDAAPLGGGSGAPPDYGGFNIANPPDELLNFTGAAVSGGVLSCYGDATLHLYFNYNLTPGATVTIDAAKLYVVVDNNFLAPYVGQTAGPQQWVFDLTTGAGTFTLDETITFPLAPGQTIWVWIDTSAFGGTDHTHLTFTMMAGGFWELVLATECQTTDCTVNLVNETLSRIAEAYTGDCLRVYSDYYGRPDAQPYPSDANGCGALRCITNGLRLRNAINSDVDNTPHRVAISMRDIFNALNAIDNIGMGPEDDPNRPGDKLIRVEPYEYFYKSDILLQCTNIMHVERKVDQTLVFSTMKGGYAKWKTWNIRGLQDFFTPRQYRTDLNAVKNELDRVSEFIASDYAIEWTRRQYGTTSADSRYDNDIFLICLTNCYTGALEFRPAPTGPDSQIIVPTLLDVQSGDSITISGSAGNDGAYTVDFVEQTNGSTYIGIADVLTTGTDTCTICNNTRAMFVVEQGVDSPTNILYPESVFNYRIAPSRNAMRQLKSVLRSYRNYLAGKLRFTDGEGNLLAQGEVLNDNACRLENFVIAENDDLGLANFDDPDSNLPLFWPEQVLFEYPINYGDYLAIKANPYGLIGFQCNNGAMEYGWIQDMQYVPYTGIATFTLRPKIET